MAKDRKSEKSDARTPKSGTFRPPRDSAPAHKDAVALFRAGMRQRAQTPGGVARHPIIRGAAKPVATGK